MLFERIAHRPGSTRQVNRPLDRLTAPKHHFLKFVEPVPGWRGRRDYGPIRAAAQNAW